MATPCLHSEDFGSMKSKLEENEKKIDKLNNDVNGNGKQGLRDDVSDLKHQMNNVVNTLEKVSEDVKAIKTSLSAVIRCQEDMDEWRIKHEKDLAKQAIEAAKVLADAKAASDDQFAKRASRQTRLMGAMMLIIALINLATFLSTNINKDEKTSGVSSDTKGRQEDVRGFATFD